MSLLSQNTTPDGVRQVILHAGRGNALRSDLLAAVERAFDPREAPAGPVVLAAEGRSFCTGLDLESSFDLDRDGMRELMSLFHRALSAVLLWPAPVVAAVQGHALAGGALLALCADRRLMAHGSHRFGIHGVRLGVVYPQVAIEVLLWRLGRRKSEQLLYGGLLRPGHQALREGLVDELVESAELLDRAGEAALRLESGAPPAGGARTRITAPLAARLRVEDPDLAESWLDHWFAPGTRARLEAARESLVGRRGPRPGERVD